MTDARVADRAWERATAYFALWDAVNGDRRLPALWEAVSAHLEPVSGVPLPDFFALAASLYGDTADNVRARYDAMQRRVQGLRTSYTSVHALERGGFNSSVDN